MAVTMVHGRAVGWGGDRPARVRSTLVALVATVSLVSAACSSGDGGGDASSTADEDFTPVTFSSPWGDSTLEARPERIAAVGYKDTDIVASMGETPVIVPENTVKQETWTLDALSKDPAATFEYTENGMPPMEELAAADPDLIIASQLDLKDVYDQLSDIAPVIAAETQDDIVGNWQQTLINLGEALGEEERADEVVQQTEDAVVAVRKKHPEFAGKTVSLIQYFGLDEMRLLNPAGGDAAALFSEMGFDEDPETTELQGVQLGGERVDDLAADVVIVLDNSDGRIGELEDSAVFRSIPAVRDGHSLVITNNAFTEGNDPSFEANGKHYEGNLAWAVAYPGPLSTQWAVETLTPLLADTAR
ncbi:MAG: ABC transporter substrate-binding protein [Corynebacterium sp.]|jgi:iron complex transport system substrate-binding protein|uniref:ABC transporter substrate-binding protein n=1 Tax=Corynebacterium sp. TaxID=1720 RepID=UPI003F04B080